MLARRLLARGGLRTLIYPPLTLRIWIGTGIWDLGGECEGRRNDTLARRRVFVRRFVDPSLTRRWPVVGFSFAVRCLFVGRTLAARGRAGGCGLVNRGLLRFR